ncbi:type II toxin-antitoxin system VapB family antitoxin [Neorhizobium sp. NPDC001467]|uniref:type II toxin-antitoxin system VapB family antitoxin n=1 Tax=Neorhizobium sp. NPDC001467 TaxID=3390595 RepID=UPI003D03E69B
MTLNISSEKADALAQELARIDGTSVTQAVIVALQEALNRRNFHERPTETARRILQEHGLSFKHGRRPVPPSAYHDLDHDMGKS